MLACLHEGRGKGSCTQWPHFSILQGVTTYMVSFLQVPSSHLKEGIRIVEWFGLEGDFEGHLFLTPLP